MTEYIRSVFEGCNVEIKFRDGTVVSGKVLKIDGSAHNGFGNLLLADGTLVRGSYILTVTKDNHEAR
jgi:hypothetical protein